MLLAAVFCSCGSGEAVTEDFAEGYPGGSQNPPATQQGESTPTPNFADCPECSNACLACIETAGNDDLAFLQCVNGPACQAYLAESGASVPEYGVSDDNILLTPAPPENGCEQLDDACLACECSFGVGAEECDFCE
jgi:hypothetical protein